MKNGLSLPKTGNLLMTKLLGNRHITTSITKVLPSGVKVMLAVQVPKTAKKSDALPFVRDLMSMNFNQKTASAFAGISPSYVSKLLHK